MTSEVTGTNTELDSTFFPNFLQEKESEEIGVIGFFI